MESLDLTYKLIALKIKSKTLDRIYFMFKYFRKIVIVMTKVKNKKMKTTKIYLFLLPPLPPQDGGHFSRQKFLNFFFHIYMGI